MQRFLGRFAGTVLALSVLLSGCAGTGSKSPQTESPPAASPAPSKTTQTPETPKEPVEIVFWDMVWGPPAYVEAANKLTEEFNRTHPHIHVTYQSTPWDNYLQTFVTAVNSGTAPDVSTGGGFQQHQLAAMGAIAPLDSIIEEWRNEGTLDDFLPGILEPITWEGYQIGIPWQVGAHVFYYRKDILEENGIPVPQTLADFDAAGAKLKEKGIALFSFSAGDMIGAHIMINLMLINGGRLFYDDMSPATLDPKNMEVYNLVADWVKKGYILEGSPGYNMETAARAFFNGQAAFLPHADRLPLSYAKDQPEVLDKIGIMPMPRGLDGQRYPSLRFVNSIMVYSQSKHLEEAKEFVKWWSENQLSLFTEGEIGALPVRKSFLADPFFDDWAVKFLTDEILPNTVGYNAGYPTFFPEAGVLEGSMVYKDLLQNLLLGKSPEEAANQAHNDLKQQTNLP